MQPTTPQLSQRLFFLDWLRIIAFAALVLYHVGMYYVSWDFHVKSPFAGPGLEPWMKLTAPWRMSLLFMVSGAAAAHMLKGGVSWALLRRRSAQLLLPLLFGVVLVVPAQPYFEVVQKFGYQGSFFDFLALYYSGYQGFCREGHCLILPTWNHLWFLPYLWLYTTLAIGCLALWPAVLRRLSGVAHRLLAGPLLFAVPIALIFLVRTLLFHRFPATHAVLGDWFNHAIYFPMFVAGAAFAMASPMWQRLAQARWFALALALSCWAVLVLARPGGLLAHAVVATFQWSALVAAFGFARQHLNVDHPLRARLTEAVFPVYILHQTVIILGSQALLPLRWSPAIEGPVLIMITFALSYGGYALVRRVPALHPWMGLTTSRTARVPTAARVV